MGYDPARRQSLRAHNAKLEGNVRTTQLCNGVLRERGTDRIEVAAMASGQATGNRHLDAGAQAAHRNLKIGIEQARAGATTSQSTMERPAVPGTVLRDPRGRPVVKGFYEKRTSSVQYVVADTGANRCAIIDPVLDFDPKAGTIATRSADELLRYIAREGYELEWILDTHPHADHFSAAGYLKDVTGVPTAIGEKVVEVQELWQRIYNIAGSYPADGSQWDRLFADGEHFKIGDLDVEVLLTPGHTLASVAYVAGDAAFIHDTLFMPDGGTARADFPGGDARTLWKSIQRILALPDDTRLFTGHDYRPGGRKPAWESTVAQQKAENIHLWKAKSEAQFVELREARDRELPMPNLILHSLQVNIRGGRLPEPEANGRRYLKIPLGVFDNAPWEGGTDED